MFDFSLASFDEIAHELGARLKALRLAQGLQQIELASRAGVSRYVVQELEGSGKCTLLSLLRIVQALGRESELQGLFELKVNSIAQMEAANSARRVRAPRKYLRKNATAPETTA
ncbi:helix-turn-helix domain-containing protein [Rhodoferax sp.]|uniref:helix-turn-helix domain-containing protein n=1 Tax=Rhodoferax sp. TaxID=50421 RepID=UPI0019E916A2|nr:helix-turn-helix domain-containing protein [Rhodoferax sp.]MBE0475025.1 transcriptional regulator [Rhodoferax sp.]